MMVTALQDEAHRFAISYHRQLRAANQVHSVLDDIPGVGAARRKALVKHFKSAENVKNASIEELYSLPEIPESVARGIYEFFHGGGNS
jgi:excinuclease ABC subunit C